MRAEMRSPVNFRIIGVGMYCSWLRIITASVEIRDCYTFTDGSEGS